MRVWGAYGLLDAALGPFNTVGLGAYFDRWDAVQMAVPAWCRVGGAVPGGH